MAQFNVIFFKHLRESRVRETEPLGPVCTEISKQAGKADNCQAESQAG